MCLKLGVCSLKNIVNLSTLIKNIYANNLKKERAFFSCINMNQ